MRSNVTVMLRGPATRASAATPTGRCGQGGAPREHVSALAGCPLQRMQVAGSRAPLRHCYAGACPPAAALCLLPASAGPPSADRRQRRGPSSAAAALLCYLPGPKHAKPASPAPCAASPAPPRPPGTRRQAAPCCPGAPTAAQGQGRRPFHSLSAGAQRAPSKKLLHGACTHLPDVIVVGLPEVAGALRGLGGGQRQGGQGAAHQRLGGPLQELQGHGMWPGHVGAPGAGPRRLGVSFGPEDRWTQASKGMPLSPLGWAPSRAGELASSARPRPRGGILPVAA